ncbi:hypothetical protein C4559_01690 [Candidatus Microgenomates bacterium]|nr:MAG: hypothetical protein C4559_01690 [Candidatus Microgenomates bacterium]
MLPKTVKDNLLKTLGIESADQDKQEEFLSSFEDLISAVVLDLILESLTDEEKETFLKLNAQDSIGEKAINYALEKIPNLEGKIGEKVKEEILALN